VNDSATLSGNGDADGGDDYTPRMHASPVLAAAFAREYSAAREALARHDLDVAFAHLERAHVLGQRSTRRHVLVHAAMLRVGWRRRDVREILGQLPRLVAAALFSALWVPAGNTGGANVGALRSMAIPADLAELLSPTDGGTATDRSVTPGTGD
jgi:hypothetical protein